jgi:hypothetical protein
MTMQVTMLQTRMGEAGSLLASGSSYTVSDAFGAWLVGQRLATDVAEVLDSPPNAPREVDTRYTAAQLTALAAAGGLTQWATYVASDTGTHYTALSASALSPIQAVEATAYVNATASAGATVFTGACEYAGYYCSVAAGNITVYDNTSAAGTPIVPTTALATGPFPVFGAGTNGKMLFGTGCHVVLSGAATVRVLVQ